MAQQTICPACGAPLNYSGQGDTVKCGFCGTVINVTEQEDGPQFSVVSQPEPQKEVLSQPVDTQVPIEPPANEPDNAVDAFLSDLGPNVESPRPEPVASGGVNIFDQGSPYQSYPPTPPPPISSSQPASKPGTPGRWIAAGIAAVVLLCFACACLGALFFIPMAQRMGR